MIALLAALLLLVQELETAPPTPYDRVVELEIIGDEPELIEGWGPTVVAEYEVEFEGTLHVWADAEIDLFLQVDDAMQGSPLVRDDDSGGGKTPWASLEVRPGMVLAALVAAQPGSSGPLEVQWRAAPETAASRAAVVRGQQAIARARSEIAEADLAGAADALYESMAELLADPELKDSEAVTQVLWDLGKLVFEVDPRHELVLRASARIHAHRSRTLPVDHARLIDAREYVGSAHQATGDPAGARPWAESVLASRTRLLPEGHPFVLESRMRLAAVLEFEGQYERAIELVESVLAESGGAGAAWPETAHRARALLVRLLIAAGDFTRALPLQEEVLAYRERWYSRDHHETVLARQTLGRILLQLGRVEAARETQADALASLERSVPADHVLVLMARCSVASADLELGRAEEARRELEDVLAVAQQAFPEDDEMVLMARENLANVDLYVGDLARAREQQELVLAARLGRLPEGHPQVLEARRKLAQILADSGDLARARSLFETALASYVSSESFDFHAVQAARGGLAVVMHQMGDSTGARALQESVVEARAAKLPPHHRDLLAARGNLASFAASTGDLAAARALREEVLAIAEEVYPADDAHVTFARENLGAMLFELGERARARQLFESVLESRKRTLPLGHPDLLRAEENVASMLFEEEGPESARPVFEQMVAAREAMMPPWHPDLLTARSMLILCAEAVGDRPALRSLLATQIAGIRARVESTLALAPRQVREMVGSEAARFGILLVVAEDAPPELQRSVFELQETLRAAAGEAVRTIEASTDPAVRRLMEEGRALRAELNSVLSIASEEERAVEVTRLARERDRVEAEASRLLAAAGRSVRPIDTEVLVRELRGDEAIVAYRSYDRANEEHLLAFVLQGDRVPMRVELGGVESLERALADWRAALGAALDSRGVHVEATKSEQDGERVAGDAVRALLLDPVLARLDEGTTRLYLCPDDLVYLCPLEALPLAEGRVGDELRVVRQVSLMPLQEPRTSSVSDPSMLALGGVEYDATSVALLDSDTSRSSMPGAFRPLPQTIAEVRAAAELFRTAFERDPVTLVGEATTKDAVFASAADKRYVHVATHGWFAPEISDASARPDAAEAIRMDLAQRVVGLAPMTLCGLALAGANRGRDSLGRVPGILTAEELCSLDLSQCELAVLSACETNVGIRRAGQGIQSLQAALYAAGARTSITSLWKVDDAATRRLFEVFYTNLWIEKTGKAEALWQAKCTLREEGHPVRDWAGWVLTGEPD